MATSPIVVRPMATPDEFMVQMQLADQAFSNEPSESSVRQWQRFITESPEYRAEEIRGAFRDGKQVGGYIIYERKLRMGEARLTTGCISVVVTHPAYRHQGVGRALMQDAINYALTHKHTLLLLDGIPKFYYRYGYTDMFDISVQDVHRGAVLAQAGSSHSIRPATVEDAQSILALYERQYGSYTGSFTRSLARQAHLIKNRRAHNPLLLAVDPDGQAQGYLSLSTGSEQPKALEMAADNWAATIALLQHHARLLASPTPDTTLQYQLPPDIPVLQWMIDKLEVPDTSMWRHPADEWGIRDQTYHHRFTGWMARFVHLPTLAQELLPALQARWQRSLAHWSGDLSLQVDDDRLTLHIEGSTLQLKEGSETLHPSIHLTAQAFTQLLFGYRTVSYVTAEQSVNSDVKTVLDILFPAGHTWIPSSDAF